MVLPWCLDCRVSGCLLGPPGTTAVHYCMRNMGCLSTGVTVREELDIRAIVTQVFPYTRRILQFAARFSLVHALFSQIGHCFCRLFSAAVGSRIGSDAQNLTSSMGSLRRSSSIAASLVSLAVSLRSALFPVWIILHRLNRNKFLCFLFLFGSMPNFYEFLHKESPY